MTSQPIIHTQYIDPDTNLPHGDYTGDEAQVDLTYYHQS